MFLQKLLNWKSNRKGFSLVELIVVIAIMAVLIAILAPSLLAYTERSRAQKDYSAMDEVANAILLGLSDADAYDEAVRCSSTENVSCYIDTDTEAGYEKVITKAATGQIKTQYTFEDDTRLADETPYFLAGNMRGLTITFEPVHDSGNGNKYVLKDGIINKFVGTKSNLGDTTYLYNIVRQTIGDDIAITSQTYRNSEYTIFIKLGTTGGAQDTAQDAIEVYGQYSGTNLPVTDPADYTMTSDRNANISDDSDEDLDIQVPASCGIDGHYEGDGKEHGIKITGTCYSNHTYTCECSTQIVPEGGTAYTHDQEEYPAGSEIPCGGLDQINSFTFGDYTYYRKCYYNYDNSYYVDIPSGWSFKAKNDKQRYGEILDTVLGEPVTCAAFAFYWADSLVDASNIVIPSTVTDMESAFARCYALTTPPSIPNGVTNLKKAFDGAALTVAPRLPEGVINMENTFSGCDFTIAPAIPSTVANMRSTFEDCTNLITPPDMTNVKDLTDMTKTFSSCTSLETAPIIPNSVTTMNGTFSFCSALKTAPTIPSNVLKMSSTFSNCTSLEGTIVINTNNIDNLVSNNEKSCKYCFRGVDMTNITLSGDASIDVLNLIGGTGNNWTPIE